MTGTKEDDVEEPPPPPPHAASDTREVRMATVEADFNMMFSGVLFNAGEICLLPGLGPP